MTTSSRFEFVSDPEPLSDAERAELDAVREAAEERGRQPGFRIKVYKSKLEHLLRKLEAGSTEPAKDLQQLLVTIEKLMAAGGAAEDVADLRRRILEAA